MRLEQSQFLPTVRLNTDRRGFSTVEAILALSVFALLATAFIGAYLYGQEATMLSGNRNRAVLLAQEGLEAARNIRDADFANLVDGTYGLDTTGNQWNFFGSSDATDIFTRQVTVSTVDASRKLVTATVTWQQNQQRSGSVTLQTWLTYWMELTGGDWSVPGQAASLDLSGNQDAIRVQVLGSYAYLVRDGGSPNFVVIDVSTPDSPFIVGSLTLTGTPSNIFVLGNYAYVSNTNNSQELQIVNISNPVSPSVVGTFNNSGNQNGTSVYVVGATAFLTFSGNDEFSVVDVSSPVSPTVYGTLNLSSDANEVVVNGDYAYIASSDNSEELIVVDISSPSTPSQVGSLDLTSNTNAGTISLVDSYLLIGQGSDLYIVDVSTPTVPSLTGSVSIGANINDISLNLGNSETYVFVGTADNSGEFKVVDITIPSAPIVLGMYNTSGNNNLAGVAYDETLDRAFGASSSNTDEFRVFEPQ